jgi:hypothetical protein
MIDYNWFIEYEGMIDFIELIVWLAWLIGLNDGLFDLND